VSFNTKNDTEQQEREKMIYSGPPVSLINALWLSTERANTMKNIAVKKRVEAIIHECRERECREKKKKIWGEKKKRFNQFPFFSFLLIRFPSF
jgi:hypothetical protein